MNITYLNTIVFVANIDVSKRFYEKVLGLKIVQDLGTIVFFENQLVLHIANSIYETIYKEKMINDKKNQGEKNILIYFETDDLEKCYMEIIEAKVKTIHGIEKQAWGQRVFRFYDPDEHIIEIGEYFRLKENSNATL